MAYRDDDKEKDEGILTEGALSEVLDKDEDEEEIPDVPLPEEEECHARRIRLGRSNLSMSTCGPWLTRRRFTWERARSDDSRTSTFGRRNLSTSTYGPISAIIQICTPY